MPTRKTRLSKAEQAVYNAMSDTLEKISIATRRTGSSEPKIKRFILEQIHPESARVHDLPSGAVVASLPARLSIIRPGVMFIAAEAFSQWDSDWPLSLEDPHEVPNFEDIIQDLLPFPSKILNEYLVNRPRPLQVCQLQGLIIATNWNRVPANYPDEKLVSFEICLRDEQEEDYCFRFKARIDRRLRSQYERQRPDPRWLAERLKNRVPLFADREQIELGVHRDIPMPPARRQKIQ